MRNKKMYVGATFGLILGAAALAPILPAPLGVAEVYATEGTAQTVTSYEEFYAAITEGEASVVTLGANITELNHELTIPAGRVVTIDLNGYELTIRDADYRGLVNRGELTITGGGILQNSADGTAVDTRGIIDNYGTLTIENVTLREYGSHNGATIRNNAADAVTYVNAGTRLEVLDEDRGNVGISATEGQVIIADGVEIVSVTGTNGSTAYYPLQVKNGTMTIGTVNSTNPTTINSVVAGIYVSGNGKLTVNNAEITSKVKQAIRVATNDAKVEINGGKFTGPYGGVYIYTTQTGTEPIVTINDGEFSGEWASVVSTNYDGNLETWALDIKGGVYAGTRIREYLSSDYKAYRQPRYFENGWAGYFVDAVEESSIPDTIYIKKSTQANLGLSNIAKKYATVTLSKEGVIVLDEDKDTITSGRTGIVKITTNLNDGSDPIETMVYSYENLLSVELVDASRFTDEEIALLDASLKQNENKVGYLDISYARVIDGVAIEQLSEAEEPVTILVEMPELPALESGYKRSYRVLHYHEGAVEVISGVTMNSATNMVGFETSSFSPFLVTYTDTKIETPANPGEGDNTGGNTGGNTGENTGDNTGDNTGENTGGNNGDTDNGNDSGNTGGDTGNTGGNNSGDDEDPKQPLIPKDNTFDFEDPADVDPLGEVYTQPAAVATAATASAASSEVTKVGVPNTANVETSSEIGLVVSMMIGSVTMTGLVLGLKKRI